MNRKRRAIFLISVVSVVLVACAGLLFVETRTKVVKRWVDDVIYDNRNHYLSCGQLPSVSEVEKIIREHQDVIHQIEEVNPGFVGVEINTCGEGNADITFWYGSHKDRVIIEQVIGSDTFFDVPNNLHNR